MLVLATSVHSHLGYWALGDKYLNIMMKHSIILVIALFSLNPCSFGYSEPDYKNLVKQFLEESAKENDIYPWKQKSEAVDKIVKVGKDVVPYLIDELQDIKILFDGKDYNFTIQQNITMALCKINGIKESLGENLFSIRSPNEDNIKVFKYWKNFKLP